MIARHEHPYIEHVEGRCGGNAVVKNSRISVWLILESYRAGHTPEEILAEFPHLTLSRIFDALGYADDNHEEIERDIEANKPPESIIT